MRQGFVSSAKIKNYSFLLPFSRDMWKNAISVFVYCVSMYYFFFASVAFALTRLYDSTYTTCRKSHRCADFMRHGFLRCTKITNYSFLLPFSRDMWENAISVFVFCVSMYFFPQILPSHWADDIIKLIQHIGSHTDTYISCGRAS